jgi:predicted alpha/beta hydrolase family esterase
MTARQPAVFLLPGLHQAAPQAFHAWAAQGASWVAQHEHARPLRGDWLMQLETSVLSARTEVLLVAHGLACWLVASWAQVSQHTQAVQGAVLVNPPDLQIPALQAQLPSWQRIALQALPFEAVVLSLSHAEVCTAEVSTAEVLGANTQAHLPDNKATEPATCHSAQDVPHHRHVARAWGAQHLLMHDLDLALLQATCQRLKEETYGH